MFSLTKKADYSLAMLCILARAEKGKVLSRSYFHKKYKLPKAFLAQIGKKLVDSGILGSIDGRSGGYFLIKDPSEIKLTKILHIVNDQKLSLVSCISHPNKCPAEETCLQKGFMGKINKKFSDILDRYTLKDLINN